MSSANGVLHEGARLAPGYEVIAHLNRGRALDVYDTWSEERACACIAKVARPDRREERVRRRLITEGELLLSLSHPHIVRAYELIRRPRTMVVLETLGGETLEHMVREAPRRLALDDVVELGLQLCSALGYLHSRGFLHLDLKPSNVIAENRQAKLIDLSLCGPAGPSKRGVGSPPYLAPEQARGDTVSEATDVWGMGVTLYEALTGARPFPDAAPRLFPQARRRAPSVAEARRVPPSLRDLIDSCLLPTPGSRPNVGELASGLDALIEA